MIRPFSGPRYHENQSRTGDRLPCAYCGKAVKPRGGKMYMAEVFDGGARFARVGDEPKSLASERSNDPGYMGYFPVGPDCRKRLAADGVKIVECPADI